MVVVAISLHPSSLRVLLFSCFISVSSKLCIVHSRMEVAVDTLVDWVRVCLVMIHGALSTGTRPASLPVLIGTVAWVGKGWVETHLYVEIIRLSITDRFIHRRTYRTFDNLLKAEQTEDI